MSLWDKPGVTSYIEDYWDSPDEVEMREQVAVWIRSHLKPGEFILDVGCGSGRIALLLGDYCYYGVDGSAEMLALARARSPQTFFAQRDFASGHLPCGSGSYPAILCMHVMRHMATYKHLLSEFSRIAREQVFIVDVFHDGDSHKFGTVEMAGEVFAENVWSLPLFLADVGEAFPGWHTSVVNCAGAVGVGIKLS